MEWGGAAAAAGNRYKELECVTQYRTLMYNVYDSEQEK